jgi:hypothetical protein
VFLYLQVSLQARRFLRVSRCLNSFMPIGRSAQSHDFQKKRCFLYRALLHWCVHGKHAVGNTVLLVHASTTPQRTAAVKFFCVKKIPYCEVAHFVFHLCSFLEHPDSTVLISDCWRRRSAYCGFPKCRS